jgi:hypothetical protein
MKRTIKIFQIAVLLLTLVPMVGRAQWSFDFLSVEALIDDHKRVRSVLLARSGLEQANELLHKYSKEASVDYDSLNVKLDKYTKCFDVIDVIYNSGAMVVNVRNTYSDVSDKISQLSTLIEDFMTKCTVRGDILSSDTIIVGACRRCVEQVGDDGQQLVNSLIELAQYATGLRHITTEGLLTVIGNINEGLDNIRGCIDHTYYVIWKYVTVRTHYFKRSLYQAKTIGEMCGSAFERWKRGALQASGVDY